MELARLASKQATSKQATTSSTGPFLVCRAEGVPKKIVTTLSGIVFRKFFGTIFFCPTPRWLQRVIYCGFGPFVAAGTYRNSGPGSKTEKRDFLELGALFGKKSVRPKSFSQKVRKFLTFCVLAERIPTGGKSQNTGVLGPFGPGKPLALREIPGRTKKNTNSLIETEKK